MILDTIVLLSGLLWSGPSYALLEQVRMQIRARAANVNHTIQTAALLPVALWMV
jgi:hypothetical protein